MQIFFLNIISNPSQSLLLTFLHLLILTFFETQMLPAEGRCHILFERMMHHVAWMKLFGSLISSLTKNTDSDPHELSDRCVDVSSSLVTDNRVYNGPLGRLSYSLSCMIAPLAPLTRSAALHFATFTLLVRLLRSHTRYVQILATLTGSPRSWAQKLTWDGGNL